MIQINKIQHIGIPVSNLVQSEAFYQSLGFRNVMASTFRHEGKEGHVAMMERETIVIELYELPDFALADIKSRKDGHIDHVAFDVSDIDSAYLTLKNRGFNIVQEAPVFLPFWENGCKFFHILGPDGERLEFNQIL